MDRLGCGMTGTKLVSSFRAALESASRFRPSSSVSLSVSSFVRMLGFVFSLSARSSAPEGHAPHTSPDPLLDEGRVLRRRCPLTRP